MARLSEESQNIVWGYTPSQLGNDAKWVWEYMADNSDVSWSASTAAADISAGMGTSLSESEVDAALTELRDKGLISADTFVVTDPPNGGS